ncbi:ATP-binding cassette-type vacuolar membrane transporter Hmt1 [Pseudogymnoascus australis]
MDSSLPIPTTAGSSSSSPGTAYWILHYVQYSYPLVLLVVFLTAFVAHSIISSPSNQSVTSRSTLTGPGGKPLPPTSRPPSNGPPEPANDGFGKTRSLLFCWLAVGLIATFVGNIVNIVVHAVSERREGWWCGEAPAAYVIGSAFLYSLFLISLVDTHPSPSVVHLITWSVALVGELVLIGASIVYITSPHREINSLNPDSAILDAPNQWEIVEVLCDATRVLFLVLCVAFYAFFSYQQSSPCKRRTSRERAAARDERTPLLNGHTVSGDVHVENGHTEDENGGHSPGESAYGATTMNGNGAINGDAAMNGHGQGPAGPTDSAAFYRPTTAPSRSWWEYLRGYSLFFPYLWPSKSLRLQITVVVCFGIVLLQRLVNVLVPIQMGNVTNMLSEDEAPEDETFLQMLKGGSTRPGMPWLAISLLIVYKLFQGTSGLLAAGRAVLWIPVSQYSYQALSTSSFEHVHGLSLDFHLGKRTGEVLSALSKGAAINTFLEQITFQVLPMLFDLVLAIVYFSIKFDIYYSLTLSVVTFWYLYATVRLAQLRAEQRRRMINADREEDAVKNDSIQSYETVKYFGAEEYESNRYRKAVQNFQNEEYQVTLSLSVMNIVQNMIFMLGFLVVSFIAAYQVTSGLRRVGEFVLLITYMAQLQQPLNFFGTFYKNVQSAMINGERLLELFKEQPTVSDHPGARDLNKCEGRITFEGVKFSYDQRKPALQDLSFDCPPGTTTALVGESGGGKSTIFRLLFRFYNEQAGRILLDNHDVQNLTIKSLRSHIGVVPQDTVLFNETIMYNLRYANQNATDEDIFNACRAASIHDKILSFPDAYDTKVGERGLRLSGGEKQRVAIARTILKNPRIIMLDEATAALDSETEQHIQEALKRLSVGRTMLVIAHRLSTITSADQILVLHEGSVYERGTHEQLLAKKGRYYNMWRKQIRAERAAEEARLLSDRAAVLREQALKRPGSDYGCGSEETSDNDTEVAAGDGPGEDAQTPLLGPNGRVRGPFRGEAPLLRRVTHDGIPPGSP